MTSMKNRIILACVIVPAMVSLCQAQSGTTNAAGRIRAPQVNARINAPVMPQLATNPAAAPAPANLPSMADLVSAMEKATAKPAEGGDWTTPLKLVIVFSGLAILPSLLVMMTSFTRIIIVLSFVRRALGTQSIPPTVAMVGLGLFLTLYTMAPTYGKVNAQAIQPYLADRMTFNVAAGQAANCLKEFMLRQTPQERSVPLRADGETPPSQRTMDLPMHVVVPAFIISEFRTAFEIGCLLFIPFLLIDLVIASVLLSAGHDDAAAGDDFAAVQADSVHPCGWLGSSGQEPQPRIPVIVCGCLITDHG